MSASHTTYLTHAIFPIGTNPLEIHKALDDYQYFKDGKSMYAVTITINQAEYNALNKDPKEIQKYLTFLLKKYKIEGIFITELTKKNVPHIHGIITLTNTYLETLKYHKSRQPYYTDPQIQNQHRIRSMPSAQAITGWKNYMLKNQTPLTILEYFSQTDSN